jgi:hypothetical protein
MSSKNDPFGNSQGELLRKSDLLVGRLNHPDVLALNIDAADLATLTQDNANMHRDHEASVTATAKAKAAVKTKNSTFKRSKKNHRTIRQRIMKKTGYTPAIGRLLGLERAELSSLTAFADSGPVAQLRGKPHTGGGAELKGKKDGADAMDIYGKRDGDKDFVFLMRVLRFPWIDQRPLLVPGKPETRQYQGQLVIHGHPAGQFSAAITVVVTG